ncbi:hypothetical protein RND81_14G108500 [Saponaria officinalis]|uniref:Glycosyltransferase n=1 Tax=Saponaria officinalis TaxID=3572 RepID=A0AAW1GQU5_SAPOF
MNNTIVLYPAPGVGHLISMVELGKLLLNRPRSRLSITIIIPSFPSLTLHTTILSYLSSVSSSFPSITFISLPPISLPSTHPDDETIIFQSLLSNNPNLLTTLQSISSTSHVCAFIVDFFCYTSLDVSCSLSIPTYFYFTSSAYVLSLFLNFPTFDEIVKDSSFRELGNMSFEIPTLMSVPSSQMMEPMLDRGASYDEFVKLGARFSNSNGIIINTFDSLECRAIKALNEGSCVLGSTNVPTIYCVGPLIANQGDKDGEKHECLSWLDLQPSKSVVYLGFGSKGLFSKEQLSEIAFGLERSGVRFLWVVRDPPSEVKGSTGVEPLAELDLGSILPKGFLERTKDRGLVVKSWAPQIAVLAHDSVGGFVTHCGWNSTLEAVCAGVPMIGWPLYAGQRFNRIVLVQEIGIALPMNESEDRFVCSDEVEKRVKQILDPEEGDGVRKRVLELRDEAKIVFNEEGSSEIALTKLVDSWILKH